MLGKSAFVEKRTNYRCNAFCFSKNNVNSFQSGNVFHKKFFEKSCILESLDFISNEIEGLPPEIMRVLKTRRGT